MAEYTPDLTCHMLTAAAQELGRYFLPCRSSVGDPGNSRRAIIRRQQFGEQLTENGKVHGFDEVPVKPDYFRLPPVFVIRYGFDLAEAEALTLLQEEYNPRCEPPWSKRELLHKIRQADTKLYDKPRGYLLNGNANCDPMARARQWGGDFRGTPPDAAEYTHPPEPVDDDGDEKAEADGDCEAPINFADPFYVARLFLGHKSASGFCSPLPRGEPPFLRAFREEIHRFDVSRYRAVSAEEMAAELGSFLEALYLNLYFRAMEKYREKGSGDKAGAEGEDESKKKPPSKAVVKKNFGSGLAVC